MFAVTLYCESRLPACMRLPAGEAGRVILRKPLLLHCRDACAVGLMGEPHHCMHCWKP